MKKLFLLLMVLTFAGCAGQTQSTIIDLASYGADLDAVIKAEEITIQIEGIPAPIHAKDLDIQIKLKLGRYNVLGEL